MGKLIDEYIDIYTLWLAAGRVMNAALGSPHEVSGAAYLPPGTAMPLALAVRPGTVALRVDGPAPFIQKKQFRIGPDVTRIGGNEEWQVADQPHAPGSGMLLQAHGLAKQ